MNILRNRPIFYTKSKSKKKNRSVLFPVVLKDFIFDFNYPKSFF